MNAEGFGLRVWIRARIGLNTYIDLHTHTHTHTGRRAGPNGATANVSCSVVDRNNKRRRAERDAGSARLRG
jgi:hypothetical protein